jgi:hypothetical protein
LGSEFNLPLCFGHQCIGLNAALFQHGAHDALALRRQRDQQMQRVNRLMSVLAGEFLRLLDGFLSFLGQFVKPEWHGFFFSYFS